MNRPVADVAALVRAAEPRLGPVRLVVVDGPAGSGKTTYAEGLAAALGGAPVLHLDELYGGWTGLDPDLYARLETQVLAPLREGRDARWQRYDWSAGRFAEWHDLPVSDVLVLEGVGSAALPVEAGAVLRVWVESPPALRLERGVARDGEAMRGEWLRWVDREAAHFAADGTCTRADVVVDGTAPW